MDERERVVEALKVFKEFEPWRGTFGERVNKFIWLFKKIKHIYSLSTNLVIDMPVRASLWSQSGNSMYDRQNDFITLKGRLSVITLLHEIGHVLNMNEKEAQEYAVGLFKEVFPEKYEALDKDNVAFVVKSKESEESEL